MVVCVCVCECVCESVFDVGIEAPGSDASLGRWGLSAGRLDAVASVRGIPVAGAEVTGESPPADGYPYRCPCRSSCRCLCRSPRHLWSGADGSLSPPVTARFFTAGYFWVPKVAFYFYWLSFRLTIFKAFFFVLFYLSLFASPVLYCCSSFNFGSFYLSWFLFCCCCCCCCCLLCSPFHLGSKSSVIAQSLSMNNLKSAPPKTLPICKGKWKTGPSICHLRQSLLLGPKKNETTATTTKKKEETSNSNQSSSLYRKHSEATHHHFSQPPPRIINYSVYAPDPQLHLVSPGATKTPEPLKTPPIHSNIHRDCESRRKPP